MQTQFCASFQSPVGKIYIVSRNDWITSVSFRAPETNLPERHHGEEIRCTRQLEEYFNGTRKKFDLQLQPEGTDFQQRVWDRIYLIPFASKTSYLDIALHLGDKNLVRAVGNATGANPIAIIIPCHRVIGITGELTGYAGGLDKKEWLLDFESGQLGLFGN